jgi:small subunit ribosomal protein S6
MNQTKRQYEATFIVNASLEDAQIESTVTHATETITRNGGEILAINRWGRKRLAYPIQKKNNGYYVNIDFVAPGSTISQLERILQLDENILRYLSIQLDKRALKARQQTIASEPISAETAPAAVEAAPVVEEPKEPLFEDEVEENESK